jgi:ribosomal protein S18 acetylase RimI-like enzyme
LSDSLLIRRAKDEDIPHILTLLVDDDLGKLHEGENLDVYQSAFGNISNDPNQIYAVAIVNDKVVGCLQVTFIPGLSRGGMWRAQIEAVRIARSLRGNGFGTIMLNWAIDRAREKGCGLVQLLADNSRVDAHRFYESLGFKANHHGFRLYM